MMMLGEKVLIGKEEEVLLLNSERARRPNEARVNEGEGSL